MKILVIGSGGREHALAWKIAQSARVSEVLVAPGNAGTAIEAKCRNVAIKVGDLDALLQLAQDEGVALTVVGPEVPLVAGVVDALPRRRPAYLRPHRRRRAAGRRQGLCEGFPRLATASPTAYYAVHHETDAALAYVREKARRSSSRPTAWRPARA